MKEGKTLLFKYYTDERVKEVADKVMCALDAYDPYGTLHDTEATVKVYCDDIKNDPLHAIEYLAEQIIDMF